MVKGSTFVGFFRHYHLREISLLKTRKQIIIKFKLKTFVYFNNSARYSK